MRSKPQPSVVRDHVPVSGVSLRGEDPSHGVLGTLDVPIADLDAGGRVVWANGAAHAIFRTRPSEPGREPLAPAFVDRTEEPRMRRTLARALVGRPCSTDRIVALRADGTRLRILIAVSPRRIDGAIVGARVVILDDVGGGTDATYGQLRSLTAELASPLMALGLTLASISEELAQADIEDGSRKALEDMVADCKACADEITRMTRKIARLSRPDATH